MGSLSNRDRKHPAQRRTQQLGRTHNWLRATGVLCPLLQPHGWTAYLSEWKCGSVTSKQAPTPTPSTDQLLSPISASCRWVSPWGLLRTCFGKTLEQMWSPCPKYTWQHPLLCHGQLRVWMGLSYWNQEGQLAITPECTTWSVLKMYGGGGVYLNKQQEASWLPSHGPKTDCHLHTLRKKDHFNPITSYSQF